MCRADNPVALCNDFKIPTNVEDRSYDEVQRDTLADVRRFLEANDVNLQQPEKQGATCLWEAAEQGHIEAVRAVLRHPDVDPNKVRLQSKTTPLLIAAYHGHKDVVEELLKHQDIEANVGAVESGISPLYMAVQEGREGAVRALMRCSAVDVNLAARESGVTPLCKACGLGHEHIVRLLLRAKGIDIESTLQDGGNALSFAQLGGHTKIVEMLEGRLQQRILARQKIEHAKNVHVEDNILSMMS